MQLGNTRFYHQHIKTNLDRVDKRKSDFIKHRLQYIKSKCLPVQQKIHQLDKEIQYYSNLVKNQNQMIQNQSQVLRLKNQVEEFKKSQSFYLSHLEDYQGKMIQLMHENEIIQMEMRRIKENMQKVAEDKFKEIYKEVNEGIRENKSISIGRGDEINQEKGFKNSDVKIKKTFLPTILKVQKYFVQKKHINQIHNMDMSARNYLSQSIIKQNRSTQQKSKQTTDKQKQVILKSKFKQIVSSFNNFQSLFKECFNKKKSHVQKSVSQLQSKLITNRDNFLQICQAIGQRSVENISFELFSTLSGDEIMTLLISFPWIQKSFFEGFVNKRKEIVRLQEKRVY